MHDSSVIQFLAKTSNEGDIVITQTHAYLAYVHENHAGIDIMTITPEIYEQLIRVQTRESALNILLSTQYVHTHSVVPLLR